jgi:hypothetical protein
MKQEKLLINDAISNNSDVISNKSEFKSNNEELNAKCVCLKCYKLRCKSRSNPREFCPDPSGPVDWRGRKINEQRKTDY